LNAAIEIVYPTNTDTLNGSAASAITYNQGGTGAQDRTVEAKLQETVSVKDFGAVGDGVTDDTAAIQAAINAAETISNTNARGSTTPLTSSSFPLVKLYFPVGKYKISSQIILGAISSRYHLVGENAIVFANNGSMIGDYLFKATGGYDAVIEGMALGSTESGCIEFDCPNVSSAMVLIKECNFVGNDTAANAGTAIKYNNQSSTLVVRDCLFRNVQHPIEHVVGDFVTFSNCWFSCGLTLNYADDTGYFNVIKNVFVVEDCVFASGPGDKGTRTAYFNCDFAQTNLTVRRNRITFEDGGGPIINWKVPLDLTNGSAPRSGFTIDDIICSPRGQNETVMTQSATPLVRLYEMPNYMQFKNLHWYNGVGLLVGFRTASDVTAFYNAVQAQIDGLNQVAYCYEGSAGNNVYLVQTTDKLIYSRWMELFNQFDYGYAPNTAGAQTSNYFWSHFTGDQFKSPILATAYVDMGADEFTKTALISLERDSSASTYSFTVDYLDTVGAVNGKNVTFLPRFRSISTGTYSNTIADSTSLDDYLFVIQVNSATSDTFTIDKLYVRPQDAYSKINRFYGGAKQRV